MLILSESCTLRRNVSRRPSPAPWVAHCAAVAPLGPNNPAAASGTSRSPTTQSCAGPDRRLLRILCIRNSRQRRWRLPPSPLPFRSYEFSASSGSEAPEAYARQLDRDTATVQSLTRPPGGCARCSGRNSKIPLALDGWALETTLPEVAYEAIAPIEVMGVRVGHAGRPLRQIRRLSSCTRT